MPDYMRQNTFNIILIKANNFQKDKLIHLFHVKQHTHFLHITQKNYHFYCFKDLLMYKTGTEIIVSNIKTHILLFGTWVINLLECYLNIRVSLRGTWVYLCECVFFCLLNGRLNCN